MTSPTEPPVAAGAAPAVAAAGPAPAGPPDDALTSLDLAVQGMTCASCAARIEKKLNRMDGVTAAVNYATGTAHVTFPADLDPAELVATVERTGYKATLPSRDARGVRPPAGPDAD